MEVVTRVSAESTVSLLTEYRMSTVLTVVSAEYSLQKIDARKIDWFTRPHDDTLTIPQIPDGFPCRAYAAAP